MTDFAASCYYARHDGTTDTDTPPERDLTTVRGAAAWGLEQARIDRAWAELRLANADMREIAQATFRHAALDCAGICAATIESRYGGSYALTWARAYRLLLNLADRADRARVRQAGDAK